MEIVWAAIVTAIATVVVALIERTRRENNRDHASNSEKLDKIGESVDRVAQRLDDHIDWHLDQK
jgi:hypothetical protein